MSDATLSRFGAVEARAARQIFRLEANAYLRAPLALFWTFIYPVMLFFILNAIFGGGDAPSGPMMSYADYLITGLVVMTMISTALFSCMAVLVEQRASGNLRNYAAMPFDYSAFFAGFTASRLVLLTLFIAVFTLVLSHVIPTGLGIGIGRLVVFLLFILAGALILTGIALLLASAITRTATAHAVANIVNIPLIFLSDLFLPMAILPPAMQVFVKLSPIYHYVNGARGIYAGEISFLQALPWIAALSLGGAGLIWLAARRFRWSLPA